MGEQQAERYNIGGKIERIVKTDDHVYEVYLNNKPMMDLEFDEDGIYRDEGDPALDGKSISDVFGKSLAERLDALPVGERLQEDGLRMGGEGMKGFYDEILPRFMDKYGKKWGIKTVDVTLPYVEESGRTMHSVDVTPEMRESVMEGQPMFLRTSSGEAYGFTKDGKIYIDPRKATAETPVHEFTHLWADGLRKANPKAWERLKGELEKEKDLFDYVKSLYPELSGDDLMDEVFAHFSGRRGAERLRSEQEKMMQKAKGVFDKAKITTMFDRLRNILHDFWTQARDLFAGKTEGIEKLSAEDFADMVLADLIKGEKPLVEGKKETRFNKAAGLDVRTYDNSNHQTRDEERERVTKEAVSDRGDILFRNDDVSEYSFRTLRSDRFYNGISNSDAFAELLDENTSWVDGSLNLLRALKKRFGGEVVSASSGAKYALEHGLVPVPDGKYSGKDGEYHHIEFESDNGERFVESVPFVDAESVGDYYGIRYSESDGVSARADMDRAHEVAEEWTEKLNLNDDVQIVDELTREIVDELMPNASEEVKEKALKAKGWFNEKTGKIVIAVGNHRNAEDVMQTILHEGVAHYGLRKLFGENFNTFLDNVYASADASVRKRIDVLQENKGYGRREAVEEYLAGLAEVTDFESVVSRTWWEKVKSLFADMLNSIGLSGFADNSLPLSDNELRYILWRSYDNLKSDNDVFRQAKDIAMQSELKVGNYDESKDIDEKNYLYREQDESENVYDAGRRSLEETLTQGLIDLSEKNRSDVGLRISAMKSISSNLSELRSAMSRQRDYDKSTVNRIVRWARMLMESGIGGNLTRYEVKRLTGMIAQAAGKEDITRQAGQVMDLLINNQLRASKDLLQKQMRIKGSKIDSRGVEVQGALDIRGQRMIGAFKEGISLGEDAFYGLPVCRNIKRPFGNFRFATIAKSIPNSRMSLQSYYKTMKTYVLQQDFRFVIVAFSVCCFYHVDAFWQVYHSSSADGMLLNDCSGNVVNVDDCLRRAVDHAFPVYVSCAEMLFVCHIFYFICFIFQCCDREYGRLIAVE